MELQQIESFIEVARTMSFSKAADRLHVTQSTISARIHKLEADLGVLLLHRSGREVSLSPFGKIFLPYAQQCLEIMHEAKRRLEEEKKYVRGQLRIGVTNPFSTYVFPYILPDVYSKFPEMKIQVVSATYSEDVLEMLRESKIDIGFINHILHAQPPEHLVQASLYQSPVVLVSNKAHPLSKLKRIPVSALAQHSFMQLSPKTAIAKLVSGYFETHKIKPASFVEINSITAAKEVIKSGAVLTILPKLVVKSEIESGDLIELPLAPPPPPVVTSVVYAKEYPGEDVLNFIRRKVLDLSKKLPFACDADAA